MLTTLPSPAPTPAQSRAGPTAPVSVVILTLNEEVNIADCLASCAWSDDVHVLDSGSEDRTVEIARSLGAQVHIHPFESFGKQRNWAIDNIPLKYEWVFHLDADERFTPELVKEMQERLSRNPTEAGFHNPHKLMFMGRWLKRSGGYPTYQMRLFHKSRMRFKDYGHGQREDTDQAVGVFQEPYLHYAFSKGLYDWIDKHNRYSSLEALEVIGSRREALRLRNLFSADPVKRRRTWKEVGYHLPFRPMVRWFVIMFILGGVFEGRAGYTYAKLVAMYEQMITLKLRLLKKSSTIRGFEKDTAPQARTQIFKGADRLPEPERAALPQPAPAQAPAGEAELGQMIPEPSPWTFREKLIRAIWMLLGRPLFRISFHNWYGFRARMLRLFGAKIGDGVRIRPSVNVEIPWNLDIKDGVTVGDYAILYSLGVITIGERTIVSQYAHLCAGTHDHTDRRFPLIRDPITIGADAWIGADAFVGPNVTIGRLSVLGARSSAYRNLEEATVYVGNPARPLKKRELH
jgi:acetyltransferase-like isoleucine patch superfamily enzyme/glycosyltransferase involved in cell wall biosynthesis